MKEANHNTSSLERNQDHIFWFIFAATLIFGLLLFNIRIDEGGDDSTYVCRAIDFLNSGRYPNYQGPLYPMVLSVVIFIFGQSLFLLKLTSLIFILAGQTLFYFTFRGKIPALILLPILAILSVNSYLLYFASQTFSEAMFILIQYFFFWALLKFEKLETTHPKNTLMPAFTVLLAFLTRTIGIGFSVVAIAYLCLQKQYRKAIYFTATLVVMIGLWYGIRTVIWGAQTDGGGTQLTSLLQKHPYQPEDGQETFTGFVERLCENSNLYFSKHLMRVTGFKNIENRTTSVPLTLALIALFIFGAYRAYRKNKFILLLALSTTVMLGITFIILQTLWDQYRLILPFITTLLIVLLYALYELFKLVSDKYSDNLILVVSAILLVLSLVQTGRKIDFQTMRKNIAGDRLYGYTTDWYQFLSMCQWVDRNLPDTAYVACRKPNMARLYASGRNFYGIYSFNTEDADELIDQLRDRHVTHVILASLRRDPLYPGQGIINTIHRYVGFIVQKYPNAFDLVYAIGAPPTEEDAENYLYEPAYLLKVDYEYVDKIRKELNND